MNPIQRKGAVISIGSLGEVISWKVWLAETEDDIVDNIEGNFEITLLLPLDQQQVDHSFDLPPVLQDIVRVVLEDTLKERSKPFQGLLITCVQTALDGSDELPSSCLVLFLILSLSLTFCHHLSILNNLLIIHFWLLLGLLL